MARGGVELHLEKRFAFIFGAVVGTEQFAYWVDALKVAGHATIWNESPYWTSGGPGAFLPWPRLPGMLTVMTPMTDPFDQAIFYLMRTGLYVLVAICITVFSILVGWFVGRRIKWKIGA